MISRLATWPSNEGLKSLEAFTGLSSLYHVISVSAVAVISQRKLTFSPSFTEMSDMVFVNTGAALFPVDDDDDNDDDDDLDTDSVVR